MPVDLHRKVPLNDKIRKWVQRNYITVFIILFTLQVICLGWIGCSLADPTVVV